jgi:hypothetical protein
MARWTKMKQARRHSYSYASALVKYSGAPLQPATVARRAIEVYGEKVATRGCVSWIQGLQATSKKKEKN